MLGDPADLISVLMIASVLHQGLQFAFNRVLFHCFWCNRALISYTINLAKFSFLSTSFQICLSACNNPVTHAAGESHTELFVLMVMGCCR